jgi:hypothetical protein
MKRRFDVFSSWYSLCGVTKVFLMTDLVSRRCSFQEINDAHPTEIDRC